MTDTSETADLFAAIWGDHPRPRILGALYDADTFLNKSELARRGGFDRTILYSHSHLDNLVEVGVIEEIRDGEQYQLTDDAQYQLDAFAEWARTLRE